ncbi:eukaryotic translation initiation factor 4E [Hymenopellis radicata]|nr:eukaryotic translation initiation factor 4E [Hymenopellis radicata]
MANYFSNHSQSRFLANSSTPSATASNPVPPNGRSRLATSKHFSTSVSATGVVERSSSTEKATSANGSSTNGSLSVHPLRNTWVYWFRQQRAPGNKIVNYEEGIKKIAAFSSVESFWSLWTHLSPPSLPSFPFGIRRPVWEDPVNISGGKWIIRLKKGVADRIWEDLVLAIIGDQFDDCRPETEQDSEWPEICGCTISVRQHEDIVSLWNRVDGDIKLRDKIRDTLRRVLNLPSSTVMEYKSNNDSMQDKSSFRNTAVDRTAP